jgi:putative ABC transport system permease protein
VYFAENVRMAFSSLRSNKLRTALTLLGVTVGVFSIIGVMTALGVLNASVGEQLSQLGSETFTVKKFPSMQMGAGDWMKYMHRKPITYDQIKFVRGFTKLPAAVSAEHTTAPLIAAYGNEKSDPMYSIMGSDDYFAVNHNFTIDLGRMLTKEDVDYARDVVVLGHDIVSELFKGTIYPIGKTVMLNSRPYTVVGTFESKGGGSGASTDGFALIPITNEQKYFADAMMSSLTMTVRARTKEDLDNTQDEVIGAIRNARMVKPGGDNDFEVETNSSLVTQFNDFSIYIFYAGFGISAIALLAASIGIMNIMLVSVTERTKEIGIRMALGAKRSDITGQFLMEAVVLCEIGGVLGILLGVGLGNLIAAFTKAPVYIPYVWVAAGLGVCSIVGIVFGLYPAMKAARMDPIEALHFD